MATIPDTHTDLLEGVVSLITVNPDGSPQATAVYTKLEDDGRVLASINDVRQKYKNMAVRPKATVFAIDPANPYRTLEIRADVSLDVDEDKAWAKDFMPSLDFEELDQGADRYVVELTPYKVNVLGPGAS